ncbi:MAG: HEAT repeat domain-containing protein [Deltaproteobacteria bacterium]|nr:HEAT repeat domain-containing protein [Deltaproteobacteria bacterium]
MDGTLKGLVGLIRGTDVEARCAALLVLTHLRSGEARVVETIGDTLSAKNVVVRDFAIGYFEQVQPPDGVGHLVPLLDSEEEALRQRVAGILAAYGQPAVTALRKLVKDAPRRRLNAIIDVCARVRTGAALDLLFELIASEDFDASRAACDALIAVVPALDPRARADLFARADRVAASANGARTALVGAAKLLGALSEAKARKRLRPLLDKKYEHAVRTHALAALAACLRGQSLTAAEIAALLPLLAEDDEAGILRPAIHLLEDQTLDRSYLPQLNQLADSPQPLVKRFAVHKLGAFESGGVVKTLIGYLTDASYARRDEAAASLKKLPAARSALIKEFVACDDERKAWTLAGVLLAHDRNWKRDALQELWHKLQSALEEREDRLYSAYFQFLNTLDDAWLAEQIRSRAERARGKKDFAVAARWLMLLKDTPAFDPEAKFALALADLKARPRVLGPVRRHDLALDLLRELAGTTFPTAERLRKDRALSPDDLFYVAFNLAEGRDEEPAVARELLEHLADKQGRTKVGKAAKNKLKLLRA